MRSTVQQPRTVQLWIENDKKRAAHEQRKGPKGQFCVQQTENLNDQQTSRSLIVIDLLFAHPHDSYGSWCSLRGLNPRLADANKSAELQALVEAEAQRQADAFRTCQEDRDGPRWTEMDRKHKACLVLAQDNTFFCKATLQFHAPQLYRTGLHS